MDLNNQKCVPCREGAPKLEGEELYKFKNVVNPAWQLYDGDTKIKREFEFENFTKAINFINEVAKIAEKEGHHPNIYIYSYRKVRLELYTHKINGLHQNDFILAAKIDLLINNY